MPDTSYIDDLDPDNFIWLDQFLTLPSQYNTGIEGLVTEIIKFHKKTDRKDAREKIGVALSVILSNLLKARAYEDDVFVAIPLNSNYYTDNRYNNHLLSFRSVHKVFKYLSRDGGEIHTKPFSSTRVKGKGRVTRIILKADPSCTSPEAGSPDRPPFMFITNSTLDIPPSFTPSHIQEIIRKKNESKVLIDYKDTDETRAMREKLTQWNEFSDQHWPDIFLSNQEFKKPLKRDKTSDQRNEETNDHSRHIDLTRRHLYRVFNNSSFNEGGRMYGGWWQSIPSKSRKFITINSHPTVEIDYSFLLPAMIYSKKGLDLIGDPYILDGLDDYRELTKKTFLALINAKERQTIRSPRPDQLPEGKTFKEFQNAIKDRHEPITTFFHTGIGLELQKVDAEIALDVMHRMMALGELALPIHDSFIVRAQHRQSLLSFMLEAFKEHLGVGIGATTDSDMIRDYTQKEDAFNDAIAFEIGNERASYYRLETQSDLPEYSDYRTRNKTFRDQQPFPWQCQYSGSPLGW